MKIFKILIIIIALIGLYFLFMTLTDYKPEEKIKLTPYQENNEAINTSEIQITTFNIGYATLDENADFFMEGGKQSKAKDSETVIKNLNAITKFLTSIDSDVYLLQEVDLKAMRSKNVNQVEMLSNTFNNYESIYAINYKVPWVPVPILKPYGYVNSGLLTLSRYHGESTRYQFPGEESWPRQLALLDRCFIETKYQVNDKELVVLNVHMSAYDAGGTIREQQVAYLKKYLETLKEKDSYVIIGGDFNHELPGTDSDDFNEGPKPDWLKTMETEFGGYSWHVINDQTTSRSMEIPYIKGENYECIIDGFLISDNITVTDVETHNLEFKNSDHNPVTIKCVLGDN